MHDTPCCIPLWGNRLPAMFRWRCKSDNLKKKFYVFYSGDTNWVIQYSYIINYRFLTTETNLKALCIFRCVFTTPSVKLFVVNVQIFGKRKNNTHKTFHILKMKAHFEKEPHFENESSFWNPFWKWKHILKKLQLAKSIKTGSRMLTGLHCDWLKYWKLVPWCF